MSKPKYIFQFGKFAIILSLPFITCLSILGFDLSIAKLLNIFELLNQLKFETVSFSPIVETANLLATILYVILISVIGSIIYVYIKKYKDGINVKQIKFKNVLAKSKEIFVWVLLFNLITFLTLSIYVFFWGMLSPFVSIGYVLFIWGFTLQILSLVYLISSQIISWGTFYIFLFVVILMPLLFLGFKLFMRFSLLLLYSIPLKLELPNLSFTERLVKCYQLLEGKSFSALMFIHIVSIALFFVAYIFSIPIYGLFLKVGLFEQFLVLDIFFKCFSYSLVMFISGITHLAISLSFYSLYAKLTGEVIPKQKPFINNPLSYPIHENGL